MTRYLQWIEQNESWRGASADRHVLDRFNELYEVLYDSDDYVPDPDAIREFAYAAEAGQYDLIYCDEDVIRDHRRTKPYFKPDYSPDTEKSLGYISGMTAIRREAKREDQDLSIIEGDRVCHIDKVLYHRTRDRNVPETDTSDLFFDKLRGSISVIILSRDHPDMLERCVKSIRASLVTDDTDIILVDNGSTDGARRR